MMPEDTDSWHGLNLTSSSWLRLKGLTPREAEIALFAAQGLRFNEIAGQLQVSVGTVKSLTARAREKLGFRSMRDLRLELLRCGITSPDELVRLPNVEDATADVDDDR